MNFIHTDLIVTLIASLRMQCWVKTASHTNSSFPISVFLFCLNCDRHQKNQERKHEVGESKTDYVHSIIDKHQHMHFTFNNILV